MEAERERERQRDRERDRQRQRERQRQRLRETESEGEEVESQTEEVEAERWCSGRKERKWKQRDTERSNVQTNAWIKHQSLPIFTDSNTKTVDITE